MVCLLSNPIRQSRIGLDRIHPVRLRAPQGCGETAPKKDGPKPVFLPVAVPLGYLLTQPAIRSRTTLEMVVSSSRHFFLNSL